MIAKGAHRRGAMDAAFGTGPEGAAPHGPGGAAFGPGPWGAGRRHGHHSPFWGGPERDAAGAFPLPPMIERTLEAWHTRAHQAPEAAEPATA